MKYGELYLVDFDKLTMGKVSGLLTSVLYFNK